MTKQQSFDGVWTAIVTPFASDGSVDTDSFRKCLDYQLESKVTGVVVAGSTGEGATLTATEKVSLIRLASAHVGSEMRVMANVGGSATASSVELAKLAADAGADSLLVVTPPYNKPTLEGLLLHYKTIGAATSLPICLYHVPSRTAQKLTIEQLQKLCSLPQVQVVKEASGDMAFFSEAVRVCDAEFLSGDDPTYLPSLALGAKGLISVGANVVPKPFIELTEFFLSGNAKQARESHHTIMKYVEALACETNPGPIKAAMALRGLCQNTLRAPLVPVSTEHENLISEVFR